MKILKQYLQANPNHYQGYVDPRFQSVAHLFSRLQDARSAYGGAACVFRDFPDCIWLIIWSRCFN